MSSKQRPTRLSAKSLSTARRRRARATCWPGMRMRDGRPLAFSVLVPAASGAREKLTVVPQAHSAAVGVWVEVESVAFASPPMAGDFDAAISLWLNDLSPSTIRRSCGSPREDVVATFGPLCRPLLPPDRRQRNRRLPPVAAHCPFPPRLQIILDDARAIRLYEPRNLAAVRSRLITIDVRPDAWLVGLTGWRVAGVSPDTP